MGQRFHGTGGGGGAPESLSVGMSRFDGDCPQRLIPSTNQFASFLLKDASGECFQQNILFLGVKCGGAAGHRDNG